MGLCLLAGRRTRRLLRKGAGRGAASAPRSVPCGLGHVSVLLCMPLCGRRRVTGRLRGPPGRPERMRVRPWEPARVGQAPRGDSLFAVAFLRMFLDLGTAMTTDGMLVLEAIERGLRQLPGQFLVCEPLPRAQSQLSKGGGVSPGVLSLLRRPPPLRSPGSWPPGPWPLAETQPAGSCPKAQGGPSQSRVG